jgi:hypothetical protein
MTRTITLVLPVEAAPAVAATRAPGIADLAGVHFGIVDNGLWRGMRTFTDLWREELAAQGGAGVEVTPFDHLAADFGDQQRALGPFGRRVRGAVTGLGN